MVRRATGFTEAGHVVEVVTLESQGQFRAELSPAISLTTLGPRCILRALLSVAAAKSPHRARMAYKVAPLVYRHADIAIANDMKKADLVKFARLDPQRITTIPVNPVVTRELEQAAAEPPDHPWFEDQVPIILGVGRLDRQKDFATLLDAIARVPAHPHCGLMILVEGPLRQEHERTREASPFAGDITLPVFVNQLYHYMANCGVFVLLSRDEGQPNVLIEAPACGAPVVATDCPSGPRDILSCGCFGRLVPVGDSEASAEAILSTLDAPIDRTLSIARGYNFTLEKSTALYLDALFGNLLSS